jgi:hypothetical protein
LIKTGRIAFFLYISVKFVSNVDSAL